MSNKIQIKRGQKVNLPILDAGEPGFTTDTKQFFIGDGSSNIEFAKQSDLEIANTQLLDLAYKVAKGTGTEISIPISTLEDGYSKTFIASANNSGSATTINGKPLYKPNTKVTPNLIAGKAYTVWYNSTGGCFFIKASAEGDAIAANVLAGKKFSNDDDTGISGTMPNNGAIFITPGATGKTIPVGYHNGSGIVTGDADLISENIKAGANIFNVAGKSSVVDTADATALASQILSGYTAYNNGTKYTGTATVESLGGVKKITGTTQVFMSGVDGYIAIPQLTVQPKLLVCHIRNSKILKVYDFINGYTIGHGGFKTDNNSSTTTYEIYSASVITVLDRSKIYICSNYYTSYSGNAINYTLVKDADLVDWYAIL